MGARSTLTEKISTIVNQSSALFKLLAQMVAIIVVLATIFLYPVKNELNELRREIDRVRVQSNTKVDERTFTLCLKNLEDKMDTINKKLDKIDNWLMRPAVVGGRMQ